MGEESCKINNKMIIDYYYDSEGNCKIYKNGKLIKEERNEQGNTNRKNR